MNAVLTAKLCAATAGAAFLFLISALVITLAKVLSPRNQIGAGMARPHARVLSSQVGTTRPHPYLVPWQSRAEKTKDDAQTLAVYATRKFLGARVKIQLAPCNQKVI